MIQALKKGFLDSFDDAAGDTDSKQRNDAGLIRHKKSKADQAWQGLGYRHGQGQA